MTAWALPDPVPVREIENQWIVMPDGVRLAVQLERCGVNVELRMRADDPNTCRWRAWHAVRYARGDWDYALKSEVEITSSPAHFHVRERLGARRGAALVFEREHESDVPRDLM